MPKRTQFLLPQPKYKFPLSPRLLPDSDHIINTSENFTYGFVLGLLPFQSTGQKQQIGYVGFQKKFDTPPLKPTKTEPSFRKLNSNLCMLFLTHLQTRELCPQTYFLSLLLE